MCEQRDLLINFIRASDADRFHKAINGLELESGVVSISTAPFQGLMANLSRWEQSA